MVFVQSAGNCLVIKTNNIALQQYAGVGSWISNNGLKVFR